MRLFTYSIFLFILSIDAFSQCTDFKIQSSIKEACAPQIVKYKVLNSVSGSTFTWNFGKGSKLGSDTIYILHSDEENVDASLKITLPSGQVCTVDSTNIVRINPKPIPVISYSRNLLCNGPDTVSIYDHTQNIVQRSWVLDGTNYFNGKSKIIHKFVNTGKKDISIIVKDNKGCRGVLQLDKVIEVFPKTSFDITSDKQAGCVPQTIDFDIKDNSDSKINRTYEWSFPGSDKLKSTASDPSDRTYARVGEFNVLLTVNLENNCSYQVYKPKFIKIGEVVNLNITEQSGNHCVRDTIKLNLSNTQGKPGNSIWKFEKGDFDTLNGNSNTVYVLPKDTGIINVDVTFVYNGCVAQEVFKNVLSIDGVKAKFSSNNNFHCEVPHTVNLTNNTNEFGAANVNYKWSVHEGKQVVHSSITKDAEFSFFKLPASYNVTLLAESSNGCKDSISIKDFIYQDSLRLVFDPIPPIACIGQEVTFNNRTKPSSYLCSDNFKWIFYDLDGISIKDSSKQRSPVLTYQDTGFYDVLLTGKNGINCVDTLFVPDAIQIVEPKLHYSISEKTFCKGIDVLLEGLSTPVEANYKYDWKFVHKDSGYTKLFNGASLDATLFDAGEYKLYFTHNIVGGCIMQDSTDVYVNGLELEVNLDTISGCPPLELNTDANTLENVHFGNPSNTIEYEWKSSNAGGTRFIDSLVRNAKVFLNEKDLFSFELVGVNSAGCKADVKSENVKVGIDASFDFITPTVCLGNKLQVRGTVPDATSYEWTVLPNDGNIKQTLNQGTYSFNIPREGNYLIQQIASKFGKCHDTLVKPFETVKVVADFSATDTLLNCAPIYLELNSHSLNGDTLFWSYGDGKSNATTSPSAGHIYQKNSGFSSGFDVSLIAKSKTGCYDTLVKPDYVVVQGPVPNYTSSNYIGCEPLQVEFRDKSIDATSLFFNYNDGSQLNESIKSNGSHFHSYYNSLSSDADQIIVTNLIAYDSLGCIAEFESIDTIRVQKRPEIGVQISTTENECVPFRVDYNLNSKYVDEWLWTLNNDSISDLQSGRFDVEDFAEKRIKVVLKNEKGCTNTFNDTIIPLDRPVLGIASADSLCQFETKLFTAEIASQSPLRKFRWQFVDQNGILAVDSSFISIPISFQTPGTKSVELAAELENGCTDTLSKSIEITNYSYIDNPQIYQVSVIQQDLELIHQGSRYNKFSSYEILHNGSLKQKKQSKSDTISLIDITSSTDSQCYVLQVEDDCGLIGEKSKKHCYIHLRTSSSISYTVDLNWTPYVGWAYVSKYKIFRKLEDQFVEIATVEGNMLSYRDTGLCNQNYTYYVKAIHPFDTRYSHSNQSIIEPVYTFNSEPAHIRNVSVLEHNKIELSLNVSKFSEFSYFQVSKFKNNDLLPIETFNTSELIHLDEDVLTSEFSYRYEVKEIDRCSNASPSGRVGKSILLKGNYDRGSNLNWTAYKQFENEIHHYDVEIEDNNAFRYIDKTSETVTSYTDKVYKPDIYGKYCYRITGVGREGLSTKSNILCLSDKPSLQVPTAFTPNNKPPNNIFKPVQLFVYDGVNVKPGTYRFVVFNRWGEQIFETYDLNEGWDGNYLNKPCQLGTYIYRVSAKGVDGRNIYKNGSVLLLR